MRYLAFCIPIYPRKPRKKKEKTKKADILLTELKAVTDLSGYALRLTISDKDFIENNIECRNSGHYYLMSSWFQVEFSNSNYLTFEEESIPGNSYHAR